MALLAYNKVEIPQFMYGTAWKKEQTGRLVQMAAACGFTAIDTANQLIHYDEARVGEALLQLQRKGTRREDLFLQTKFTPLHGQGNSAPYDASADLKTQVNQSFESSLKHLHSDYIDSYVLHGPYHRGFLGPEDWEVWAAIEAVYQSGKVRMIGVSNVSHEQLEQLCAGAKHRPMIVQNRCFAVSGWDQKVRKICREKGIIYQGFSLLTANAGVLSSSAVLDVAERLQATPEQVIFRFSMQVGMLPLTGTSSERHMKEDLLSAGLELSQEELELIEKVAG